MKDIMMTSLANGSCDDDLTSIDLNNIPDEALFQGDLPEQVDIQYIISDSNNTFSLGPRGPPQRNDDPGLFNFRVEVHSKDVHRKKFLFSHKLNRIYVNIETDFPVQFNWDLNSLTMMPMYVRATVVFEDESQAEKRVERCIQHKHGSTVKEQALVMSENVLHSSRPPGSTDVQYCGHPDDPDYWYSVVVQLSKTGAEPCTHAYKFVCKNSCTTGINRRSIAIIFTLEDISGKVYGRQIVGARVCSCIGRDIKKDEESEGVRTKKRVKTLQPRPAPSCKKIKLETVGDSNEIDTFTLPPLEVIGVSSMRTGLEVMLRMMEQAAAFQQDTSRYETRIESLKQYLEMLDKNHDMS